MTRTEWNPDHARAWLEGCEDLSLKWPVIRTYRAEVGAIDLDQFTELFETVRAERAEQQFIAAGGDDPAEMQRRRDFLDAIADLVTDGALVEEGGRYRLAD